MIFISIKQLQKKVSFFLSIFCLVFKKYFTFALPNQAGIAQLVEHDLAKVGVAGSSPVSRSKKIPIPKKRGWDF